MLISFSTWGPKRGRLITVPMVLFSFSVVGPIIRFVFALLCLCRPPHGHPDDGPRAAALRHHHGPLHHPATLAELPHGPLQPTDTDREHAGTRYRGRSWRRRASVRAGRWSPSPVVAEINHRGKLTKSRNPRVDDTQWKRHHTFFALFHYGSLDLLPCFLSSSVFISLREGMAFPSHLCRTTRIISQEDSSHLRY